VKVSKAFYQSNNFFLDDVVGKLAENYVGNSVENWVDDSE